MTTLQDVNGVVKVLHNLDSFGGRVPSSYTGLAIAKWTPHT